ncbi:Trans-zeatin O-beta-D-glucosyltransferase [Bertholletia excelsa]
MGKRPHVVVVPYPAQGHVKPLMKLAYRLADYGIKVTFFITKSTHDKISDSWKEEGEESRITLASVPDLPEDFEDADGFLSWLDRFRILMQCFLKELIQRIDESQDGEKVRFVIGDATLGWILEVPREMGIRHAAVWPGGPGSLVLLHHIPKLIEAGIIDMDGATLKTEPVRLSEEIPPWSTNEFAWSCPHQPELQSASFKVCQTIKQAADLPSWLLCNTFHELHPEISRFIPNMLPVGPLLTTDHPKHCNGSLKREDHSCSSWLDEMPLCSVVYVSFGSIANFTKQQFDELALGLELARRPFLWVVRPDSVTNNSAAQYPDGFKQRVASFGKIVEWAPQENVLAHPSIACFFTHCGWNSTMEGVCAGLPFLCWPYFTDQFNNRNLICDSWKVGLKLNQDQQEISRHEIKTKIEKLLTDKEIKENALKLQEMALKSLCEGGSSSKNLETFVKHVKG